MVEQAKSTREVFRFGEFEISRSERLLLRRGHIVSLQARPFDLLLYLIENSNRVVSWDELLRTVWKGIRVNEQAMRFAVHAVRRAIGDTGQAQQIVRTVRGNGLQFIARLDLSTEAATRPTVPSIDYAFLGREIFLEHVTRAVRDASSGRFRTLLTAGEPGVGKTTALHKAAAVAARQGFRVGYARCIGTDEAPALWPWTQALRQLIEGEEESRLVEAIENDAEEVAWLLPELREIVPGATSPTFDSRASRYRLLSGLSSFLRKLAAHNAIALFVDDLHEADQGSLELFEQLASELAGTRALLFGTFRGQGAPYQRCARLVSAVLSLHGSELVTLNGLGEEDVLAIAEHFSGYRPSTAVVHEILAKTNGNPFFVSILLRVLDDDGRLETLRHDQPLEYSLPRGIRDAIMRQVRMLPDSAIHLLRVAAVIEKDFSVSLLERALRIDLEAILVGLETAVDAGICVSDGEGASYRFAHALVREAIHASLTVAERARNNGSVALALCETVGPDPGPTSAAIAHHFASAFPDPIAVRAIEFLILAAKWDVDRAAFDSAAAHLERARALFDRLCPGNLVLRSELCLERGWVYGLAGKREDSRAALEECSRLGEQCGRPDLMARSALLFSPDLLAIETGIYDSNLVALLERALRTLPNDDPERPRILARLAVALHWSEIPRDRIHALVDRAVSEAGPDEATEMASFVRTAGRLALYSVEHPEQNIWESRVAGAEDGSTSLMRMILRITALWQIGRIRDVDIEIDEFSQLLQRVRRPSAAWYVKMLRATMALMKGEYAKAGDLADQFLQQGLAVDDRNALHSFALQHAMLVIDVGNVKELEPAVISMASTFPRVEGWQAGLCYLYCELGKVAEAQGILEKVLANGALNSYPRNSWFGTLCSLTLACRAIDSPAFLDELYSRWAQFEGQMAVVGFSSFCWGSTDRFLGILASLMSKWEIAREHFVRAIAANRAIGAGPAVAHAQADFGAMLDRKRMGDGREMWDSALEQARVLGMVNLERRILREAY